MLSDQPLITTILVNILLGAVWHYATFFICIFKDTASFSPDKKMYQPHKWENGGKFYSDVLKINQWKDLLPQHIGKDGFSKNHLDDISIEYIDRFIMETCRGEWNHKMNCWFFVIIMLINPLFIGLILTFLLFMGNLPFVFIQRYNRLRLQKLRKAVIHKAKLAEKKSRRTESNALEANSR